jgi:hypothetical protein
MRPSRQDPLGPQPFALDQRLAVRVDYREIDLREKVWEMRYEDVVSLGLETGVVAEDGSPP